MTVDFMEMWKHIVWCSNINLTLVKSGTDDIPDFDLGLRQTLLQPGEKEYFIQLIRDFGKEGTICYVNDYFDVEYSVVPIPKEEPYGDFVILGPYRDGYLDQVQLNELMERKAIPRSYVNELKEYYNAVPILNNMDQWREMCRTMTRVLYQEKMHIREEYVTLTGLISEYQFETAKDVLSFRMIEERYAVEADMLKAISAGNTEEAVKAFNLMGKYKVDNRYKDPVRNLRNRLVIANTVCRKAAEAGGVHPAHIDALSVEMSKRIETISRIQEYDRFIEEILRKYCMLVRNYSLRGCSPVIQKVVNHINLNLTDDLSLKRMAEEYSVNSSYLSTLFKKEMSVTYSDYVNQQRIRQAVKLLNSTNMQIQDVASESGIYDANYFRKLFKKIIGMTPTEYVRQVKSYPKNAGPLN